MSDTIRIFRHAVKMVFQDFGATLRATSAGLMTIALAGVMFIVMAPETFTGMSAQRQPQTSRQDPSAVFGLLLALVVYFIGLVVTVIAWHRYVLLPDNQRDGGFTPGTRIVLGYTGRSLMLGIALAIVLSPLLFLFELMGSATPNPVLNSIGTVPLEVLGTWVLLRLSLILPACAVGKKLTFKESWNATKSVGGTIFGLAALLTVLAFAVTAVLNAILPASILTGVIGMGASVLIILINVGTLTTLYGITIEKRQI